MDFFNVNFIAILVAAIAGMISGAVWYGVFAKQWMKAVGFTEQPQQNPKIYIVALISQFIIAYMLYGVILHVGTFTIGAGILSAIFCWIGFTLAPMAVNHRFQGAGWDLTIIDSGYWLLVFVLQGAIIGWFGS